ncbi:undecaprenyl-phosphate glucose phosphotransferase [Thiolapillus sp.]
MFKSGLIKEYSPVISFGARLLDLCIVVGGGLLAHYIRFGHLRLYDYYEQALVVGALLAAIVLPMFRLYHSWRGKELWRQIWRISLAWAVVVLILVLLAFGLKSGALYSRYWAILWALIVWGSLVSVRIAVRLLFNFMRERGWNHRHIYIMGAGDLGRNVAHQLREASWVGYDLIGFWDDNPKLQGTLVESVPVMSCEEGCRQLESDKKHIDEIWLALPLRAEERMREVLRMLRHNTVNVRLVPDIFGFHLLNHSVTEVAGVPVLDLRSSPMRGLNRIVKAVEDRVLAALILLLISPLMVLIAAGVKISSPGPVLFKQKRHGWDGKPIKVYKFRTMKVHQEEDGQVTQAKKNDPRVTRFGAFLRRTSLDELPQFFNVLQGRMSIVGPRPHALAHNEMYKDQVEAYMQRHRVKPGITGWAQINGWRGETDTLNKMEKRVEYDLYYIENWSLWLDLKIILLTLFRGFVHKKAY